MVDIYVLDKDFQTAGVIDVYESLLWTDRFYTYGEFELYTAFDPYILETCQQDYYVFINESEHMMIIEGVEIESDPDKGNNIKITGRSLESILDKRIIWTAANISEGYTKINNKTLFQTAAHDLIEDCIIDPQPYKGNRNNKRRSAKQKALSDDRKIENFEFDYTEDPAIIGLTLPLTYYYGENLYDVMNKLFADEFEGTIGYKITLDNENHFHFKLYTGVDRSYNQQEYVETIDTVKSASKTYYEEVREGVYVITSDNKFKKKKKYYEHKEIYPCVVFSPDFDNVVNSNYLDNIQDMKNVTLVAGEEEQAETPEGGESGQTNSNQSTEPPAKRKYTLIVGKGSGITRREMFTDASDLREEDFDDTDDLMQALKDRGRDDLHENSRVTSYEGEVEAIRQFVYGKDFFMGDVIQMANEYGIEGSARVVEWVLSIDKEGIKSYPTFDAVQVIDDSTEDEEEDE